MAAQWTKIELQWISKLYWTLQNFIYLYVDTRSCTHNFMSIKQKKRMEKNREKKMENGIGNLLWISRINFFLLLFLLFDIRFRLFRILLSRAMAFIQNLIQYSEIFGARMMSIERQGRQQWEKKKNQYLWWKILTVPLTSDCSSVEPK